MPERKKIVVTGMAVNTPLGDTLEEFIRNLLLGHSAITAWKGIDTSNIACKIGGDLTGYDVQGKLSRLRERIPEKTNRWLNRLTRNAAWSVQLSNLLAVDAFLDADAFRADLDPRQTAVIIGGYDLNEQYMERNLSQFARDPALADAGMVLKGADSDHASSVSETLNAQGPVYLNGGTCGTGNISLRSALDEIRYHDMKLALVLSPVHDVCAATLHSLVQIGALSCQHFNEQPTRASRPFDVDREGFVFCQGGGALLLEEREHALSRGARIYAEILEVEINSNASRAPSPSEEHEVRVMESLLRHAGIAPQEVDFISAHATSTQQGDLAEIRAIKKVFGEHASRLKINAPKSILGHCYLAAAVVETVAAILQMQAGRLHPSINIERLDREVDLDVCANQPVDHSIRTMIKNSFGMGGFNTASLIARASDRNSAGDLPQRDR